MSEDYLTWAREQLTAAQEAFDDAYVNLQQATSRYILLTQARAPKTEDTALMPKPHPVNSAHAPSLARMVGYSGDVCNICQSTRMRRAGTCQICEDCKNTTGCS